MLRPWHIGGHIVADTNVSPFAPAHNICCGHKFCVRDTKNVSDFVQKHFVSATNVSQFAQRKKHHEKQCVRNNVSSFASTFTSKIYFIRDHTQTLSAFPCGRTQYVNRMCSIIAIVINSVF